MEGKGFYMKLFDKKITVKYVDRVGDMTSISQELNRLFLAMVIAGVLAIKKEFERGFT